MLIHPLVVHFPIAFLVIYALMEVISPFVRGLSWWDNTKAFLIIAGWLMVIPAIVTGIIAEDIVGEFDLVEAHSHTMWAVTAVFFLPFAAYLVRVYEQTGWGEKIASMNSLFAFSWRNKKKVARFILKTPVLITLAILGLVLMTIGGSFGAAIAHGTEADFIVSFIYHLFFGSN